jgi:cytochrome c
MPRRPRCVTYTLKFIVMNSTLAFLGGVALGVLPLGAQAADPDLNALLTKSGCVACHNVDKKIIGPSYKDVAAKYKGQPDAAAMLFDKVRKGGSGVWGPAPMPPHVPSQISDDDLKHVIAMILKL